MSSNRLTNRYVRMYTYLVLYQRIQNFLLSMHSCGGAGWTDYYFEYCTGGHDVIRFVPMMSGYVRLLRTKNLRRRITSQFLPGTSTRTPYKKERGTNLLTSGRIQAKFCRDETKSRSHVHCILFVSFHVDKIESNLDVVNPNISSISVTLKFGFTVLQLDWSIHPI
jgi:hypothetical protein